MTISYVRIVNATVRQAFRRVEVVIGRIFKPTKSPEGTPWMWTLAYREHEDRTPTHGYEATQQAAMQAFARSWHRET
jgi:hypothetical protein